jgi:hypothetical protein
MQDQPGTAFQYRHSQAIVKRRLTKSPIDIDRLTIYPGWGATITSHRLGLGKTFELIVIGRLVLEDPCGHGERLFGNAIGFTDRWGDFLPYPVDQGLHAAPQGGRFFGETISLVPMIGGRNRCRFRLVATGAPVLVWFIPPLAYRAEGTFDARLREL